MKRLVIEIQKGGLGDHLFYSHLPRIAKETNAFDEVFISNKSIFRNLDYKKLIWELNPYVDGFIDESGLFYNPQKTLPNQNLLDAIMFAYGLNDGYVMHEPEIYYQPELNAKWKDANIYDPNFVSYTGDLKNGKLIQLWFSQHNILVHYQMQTLGKRHLLIDCPNFIKTNSVFDFCSLLISCNRMYCLTTGSATLSAAFKKPVTVFYGEGHLPIFRHSALHSYISLGSDYNGKDKLKKKLIVFLSKYFFVGTK